MATPLFSMSSSNTSPPYFVTGCNKPYKGEAVWPRLEINQLAKKPFQFSLFIQSMKNLQAEGYTPIPASWKEIAGIHGVPWAKWAGDPQGPDGPEQSERGQWDGYCYHSCVLFPTWHRVVLLFLEQAVSNEAQAIVSKYTYLPKDELASWNEAALTLRFPYWDWSDTRVEYEGIPKILSYENLRILGPGKTTIRLRNPLRGYTYDSPPDDAPTSDYRGDMRTYFDQWKRTVRWATSKNDPSDDYMALDTALKKGLTIDVLDSEHTPEHANFKPISVNREKLIRVFSFPSSVKDPDEAVACWDHFATTRPQSTLPERISKFVSSLEEPHNNLHNDIGGNGNMSSLEMAGYDPIFYLHHCNIDRLYALWEYVYPDYWMGDKGYVVKNKNEDTRAPFKDPWGTYQGKPEASITETTGLAPFRKSNGKYWTSKDVRGLGRNASVEKFYTYPPLTITSPGWRYNGEVRTVKIDLTQTRASNLREREKYIASLQWYFGCRPIPEHKPRLALPPIFRAPSSDTTIFPDGEPVDGTRDFVVIATLPQFAFRGSYRLELYLNRLYVGDVSVFSRTKPEKCQNCSSNIASGTAVVRGVVGLPHDVVVSVLEKNNANTDRTSEDDIVRLLKENLVGRLVRPDRTLLARGQVGFVSGDGPDDNTRWINDATEFTSYSLHNVRDPIHIAHYPVLPNPSQPTLEIHSARLVLSRDSFIPPIRDDVKSHGIALEGEWRRWHAGADSD